MVSFSVQVSHETKCPKKSIRCVLNSWRWYIPPQPSEFIVNEEGIEQVDVQKTFSRPNQNNLKYCKIVGFGMVTDEVDMQPALYRLIKHRNGVAPQIWSRLELFQPSYPTIVLVNDLNRKSSRFSRSDGGDMAEDNG